VADVPTRTGLLIDGLWADRDGTLPVVDPWSGTELSQQAVAEPADVDRAVEVARRLLGAPLPRHERAAILDRTADLLVRDRDHLARIVALEAAKPIAAARLEVDRAV
jgi:acyl-CoA reductase-like NAD-dependent aldehyde dehydrogenase